MWLYYSGQYVKHIVRNSVARSTLPGTTFSNITERGTYPSDTKACLTLQELERWLKP